ncbi:hypothetical protein [Chloroflexus sp.]
MLAPIVGHIDSERTSKLTQRLLEVVSSRRIKLVVIDVAGIPTFNTARSPQDVLIRLSLQ